MQFVTLAAVGRKRTDQQAATNMIYSDFNLEQAKSKLGLKIQQTLLFEQVEPLPIPAWLQEALAKGVPQGLSSEKARSEFIVVPILLTGRDVTNQGYYI